MLRKTTLTLAVTLMMTLPLQAGEDNGTMSGGAVGAAVESVVDFAATCVAGLWQAVNEMVTADQAGDSGSQGPNSGEGNLSPIVVPIGARNQAGYESLAGDSGSRDPSPSEDNLSGVVVPIG